MALTGEVNLVWAAQVSLVELGARLTSFVETRASVTTFRLARRASPITACHKMPEEIAEMIVVMIRDMAFERNLKKWVQVGMCLARTCTTLSHISADEIDDILNMPVSAVFDDAAFDEEADRRHEEGLERWHSELTDLKGKSDIAKCVRIFAEEFSIRPYFMISRLYHTPNAPYEVTADAKAYLILPLARAPVVFLSIDFTSVDEKVSFGVESVVDDSLLTGLTADQHKKFSAAARALNLLPYDADEDELLYATYCNDEKEDVFRRFHRGAICTGEKEDSDVPEEGEGKESILDSATIFCRPDHCTTTSVWNNMPISAINKELADFKHLLQIFIEDAEIRAQAIAQLRSYLEEFCTTSDDRIDPCRHFFEEVIARSFLVIYISVLEGVTSDVELKCANLWDFARQLLRIRQDTPVGLRSFLMDHVMKLRRESRRTREQLQESTASSSSCRDDFSTTRSPPPQQASAVMVNIQPSSSVRYQPSQAEHQMNIELSPISLESLAEHIYGAQTWDYPLDPLAPLNPRLSHSLEPEALGFQQNYVSLASTSLTPESTRSASILTAEEEVEPSSTRSSCAPTPSSQPKLQATHASAASSPPLTNPPISPLDRARALPEAPSPKSIGLSEAPLTATVNEVSIPEEATNKRKSRLPARSFARSINDTISRVDRPLTQTTSRSTVETESRERLRRSAEYDRRVPKRPRTFTDPVVEPSSKPTASTVRGPIPRAIDRQYAFPENVYEGPTTFPNQAFERVCPFKVFSDRYPCRVSDCHLFQDIVPHECLALLAPSRSLAHVISKKASKPSFNTCPPPASSSMAQQVLRTASQWAVPASFALFVGQLSLYDVKGGSRAVIFDRLSGVKDTVVNEGTHFLIPWLQKAIVYDVRTKPRNISTTTGSKDLQMVSLTLRVLHRPEVKMLPKIYQSLGLDYDERVLPSIGNEVLKSIVAQFDAAELITQRESVSNRIRTDLLRRAQEFNIALEDVSITHMTFGKEFTRAVEQKQIAQQDAERSRFIVEKAEQERQANVIRAEGEAESADTISKAVARAGDGLIMIRRIEASREIAQTLAGNPNVTYLPGGGGGEGAKDGGSKGTGLLLGLRS
ncbi:MAG: hypothetical protein Q9173_003728 [Seirophora scorigena]